MFFGKVLIAYGLVLLLLKQIHIIRKKTIFFLLFIIWVIAYLYSPYWLAFGTFGFPNLKYVAFLLLFLFGLVWAYFSASDLKLPKAKIYPFTSFFLILSLYVVNYRQLNADIPWRGDEDFHVIVLLRLKEYLSFFFEHADKYLFQNPLFWVFLSLMVIGVYLSFIQRRARVLNVLLVISILSFITLPSLILLSDNVFTDQKNIFLLSDVLRYPFFQKWVNFFFIVPDFYNISLYRIIPFLSLTGIASFLFYAFYQKLQSKLLAFLFSFAFSTIPILLFYSSILYLEMPIIFLMLLCVWNIKILVKDDSEKLKQHYVWYILLLLSFLKESVLIFLLLIFAVRMSYQMFTRHKGDIGKLFLEAKLAVSVLSPVIIYIMFRNTFSPHLASSYGFFISNILSISNYVEILKSFITQMSVLPIIGMFGLFFLVKKDVFVTRVIVLLFVVMTIFSLGYLHKDYRMLVGYSRWNLFLLPVILFATTVFVNNIINRKRTYGIILLLIIFACNIVLFPFKPDGTRLSNWGSSRMDIAEYTYPYDKAIHFLSNQQNKPGALLLFGQYSPYFGLRFYLDKYNFHPEVIEYPSCLAVFCTRFDEEIEWENFKKFFDESPSADAILYHSVNSIDLDMNKVYGGKYTIARRVQNSLHSIYIFRDESFARE